EPLRVANRFRTELYRWHVISADGAPVTASNGIPVAAEAACACSTRADRSPPRRIPYRPAGRPRTLGDWLRRQHRHGATLGGIDTGSFVLAECGQRFPVQRERLRRVEQPGFRE
ncbi:GlxA family transcriptional regulator, partial [Burkholderia cenocepacia]|nr:GlxA family transcriptional regulator [Burkholderia cenocepacia]